VSRFRAICASTGEILTADLSHLVALEEKERHERARRQRQPEEVRVEEGDPPEAPPEEEDRR
jgi:hypothetical protein